MSTTTGQDDPVIPLSHASSTGLAAGSEPELIEKHEDDQPTASHVLAEESGNVEPEEKGAAQQHHGDVEVKNLGWNDDDVPKPLVGGLPNEELWTMTRRFNKQIFHVKRIEEPPLANLDLNIADGEEFSPEKLRSQLERLYMVVIVGLFSAWKHIARLRSWKETRRTAIFAGVYGAAWLLDVLVPTITAFLIVLILYPPARTACFPPAPPSLIDAKTGGVQKPPAGVLASDDSVTGAPEKHKGEAVEQEAHSFVTSLSTVCSGVCLIFFVYRESANASKLVISTAAGKHPQGDPHEDTSGPDPTELTADVSLAKDKTNGDDPAVEHDRTKTPVSRAVWDQARPVMHMMADFVDTWERFGNALSPTVPFPRQRPQLILAACLVPMLLGSYFTSSYLILRGVGFAIGFGFFGDPIIMPSIAFMNNNYPNWTQHMQLRHTILRGIPTNVQLVITLLRVGEKHKAPLPPPPTSDVPPPVQAHATAGQDLDHLEGATNEEIEQAIHPDTTEEDKEEDHFGTGKTKKSRRILNLLKGTTKGGVKTAITADKAKAQVGAKHARNRLGVVKNSNPWPERGPVVFPARYNGKKGNVYITTTATTPAISWTKNPEDVNPAWTVSIGDILELKKVGGLGWKSKIIVGWAMGREVVDGLVIKTKGGDDLHLTAINMRDDLFNRLIAMGSQMWEAW